MESKNKVLEALQMQPLSEEEKASRHILARLYGPIATTKEKTRNGRGYNAELWKRALADEIFREKVANKSLFLELGHPADREETDMEKVCACIPELPKIVDGDLYAYVDILDTKNGQLLKTLCDYGFVPGISSRGSGDVMDNNEVDPETFFLETWDIVQLPAVKKARLTMCESLDNKKTLKTALRESFEQMNDEELKEAKATLERFDLDMDLNDFEDETEINWMPGEGPEHNLAEETESVEAIVEPEDTAKDPDMLEEADAGNDPESEEIEELAAEEDEEDEAEDVNDQEESSDEEAVSEQEFTVEDFIDNFKEYDGDLKLEFKPIEIEGNSIEITELIIDDEEDGKVIVSFNYDLATSDNIEENEEESNGEESSPEDVEEPEVEEASEEAVDNGDDEVIESLMTAVRQKDALEEEVSNLKSQLAVSGAEVNELKEELDKYKTGFIRMSELASETNRLQKENKHLQEAIGAKDKTIHDLEAKAKTRLIESADSSKRKINELNERLATVQTEADAAQQELREQVETTRATAQKNAKVATAYKQKYLYVVEHYIASKAKMLGVSTRDITSKLHEGYTLEDVDQVCETLLETGRPSFGFTRSTQGTAKMKVNESFNFKKGSDDDLSDLLELAGLN